MVGLKENTTDKPVDYKVIDKVKVISKEKLHSDKIEREFGKIYVDDGSGKDKLLMVFRNSLLEKIDALKEDVYYNFFGEYKSNFFHTEGWEVWDCSECKREKLRKHLVSTNNRTYVLKSIFKKQMELWKINKVKNISLETIEEIFKDIVEELDKDFGEQKTTLESLEVESKVELKTEKPLEEKKIEQEQELI